MAGSLEGRQESCWQLVQGSGVPSAQHGTGTGAAGLCQAGRGRAGLRSWLYFPQVWKGRTGGLAAAFPAVQQVCAWLGVCDSPDTLS